MDDGADDIARQRPAWQRTAVSTVLALVRRRGVRLGAGGQVGRHRRARLREQNPAVVLAALALCTGRRVAMSFLIWRGTLAALGSRLPVRTGARLFFVGQLGKYLPGDRCGRSSRRCGWAATPGCRAHEIGLAFLLTLGLSTLVGPRRRSSRPCRRCCSEEGNAAASLLLVVPVVLALLVPQGDQRAARRARCGCCAGPDPRSARSRVGTSCAAAGGRSRLLGGARRSHVWVLAMGLGADPVAVVAGGNRRVRDRVRARSAAGGAARPAPACEKPCSSCCSHRCCRRRTRPPSR